MKSEDLRPTPGTIIFSNRSDSLLGKAVSESATAQNPIRFNHVGIAANYRMVIHSTSESGVVIESLEDFLKGTDCWTLKSIHDARVAARGLARAYSQIGRPYNRTYYQKQAGLYCSELVTECYLRVNGERYFDLEPMNFRDKDGEVLSYWLDYYKRIRVAIPENIPGSHPNGLYLQNEKYR